MIGHINALSNLAITIDNIPWNLHAIMAPGPSTVGGNVARRRRVRASTTAPVLGLL